VASEAREGHKRSGGQGAAQGAAAPRLLTVKEAAAILKVSTATVYSMVERGELEHVRVSNSIRICLP
jgi:excisionase family DNA binding protein